VRHAGLRQRSLRFRVQGTRFKVQRFRVQGSEVQGPGFKVQGSGFRVQGSRFRVQGSGFKGSGFKVQGRIIEKRTAEYRITNIECRRMESLRSVFFKIGRIHYFDIRHLSAGGGFIIRYLQSAEGGFDIRFFRVSFSIRPAVFLPAAGLTPETYCFDQSLIIKI
jgi:hypothetical protein